MPLYNQEKYVQMAIESVVQQTHTNWELVIIDDKSTDNSLQVALEYKDHPKITILQNSVNKGCYYTRNRGLYEFRDKEWDLFTIHDPDDMSDITRFEKLIPKFDSRELVSLKTTYIRLDAETNEPVYTVDGKPDVFASEGIAIHTRRAFELNGYFDDTRFAGDTEYVLRLSAQRPIYKDMILAVDNQCLYMARLHQTNLTVLYPISERRDYYESIQKNVMEMTKTGKFYRPFIP